MAAEEGWVDVKGFPTRGGGCDSGKTAKEERDQ